MTEKISACHYLSLIITAYNEEEALPKLINEIVEDMQEWTYLELIIVNDGSLDQTQSVMHDLANTFGSLTWLDIKLIHFAENRGMGAALKAGFDAATQVWISFLPGDGQIEPRMIKNLCTLIQDSTILVTTRYTNREYNLYRKVISKGLRIITFMILWTHITSEGMYLIQRDALNRLNLISDSFMLNLEIPIRIAQSDQEIQVANIQVRERQGGTSQATNWQRILNTFKDLIYLRWRIWRESRRN